ncbi:MAG: hypothetical protein LBK07_08750 [Tannerella sp.]|jgi:hypothetical protein|nr:hypothetical protein [Tannerella sp.]
MQTKTFLRKLQRRIDTMLRSTSRQVAGLTCFTVAVFFILWAGALLFSRLHVTEWVFAFLNPGSTFSDEATDMEKVWALLVGLAGMILLGGLLISIFSNILQRRIDRVRNGQVHYVFSNHVLIIGYDRMAISLVRQVAGNAAKYGDCEIVLQTVRKVPDVHHELFSNIPARIEKRITILSGNRNSAEDLEKLQPERCREIILLGESDEYDHDSLNIKCLEVIAGILKARGRTSPVRCHVLFEYQSTYAVFQQQDLLDIRAHVDFVPFNFYESWAQKVLVDGRFAVSGRERDERDIIYPWLDREPLTADSPRHVHLVISGMSRMGIAVGIQAAHLCHFPNFETRGIRTRITFIDDNAEREMNFLQGRFRHLFSEVDYTYRNAETGETRDNAGTKRKFTDIRFEFIKGRVEQPAVQQMLAEWADRKKDPNKLLTIAICFHSSPAAIAAGLYLPEEVYTNEIPIFIRQETSYCTLSLLSQAREKDYRKYRHVKPFGMLDHAYDLDRAADLVPMRVNYVYDYYFSHSLTLPDVICDEDARTMWRDLSTALKWSNRFHANMTDCRIRSLSPGKPFEEQIETLARVEHSRWCIEKLLMGYRQITGEERQLNNTAKEIKTLKNKYFIHTDICSFDELEDSKKEVDRKISAALFLIKNNRPE